MTHLDNLADKLREERVRRVVAPMLSGAAGRGSYAERDRDVEYARDLGLLARDDAKRIANPNPDVGGEDLPPRRAGR